MSGENAENITYNVTVADSGGNKYFISDHSGAAPTLTLRKGSVYRFDQSDNSNIGHLLQFSTTSNGTHGGGSAYSSNVVTTGSAGSAGAYTEITVTDSTPSTLYYYCTAHSGMGGTANVIEPVIVYNHEQGLNYDSGSVFCETGPISIGNGDKIAKVNQVIPDELTQGDVDLKFKTRFYPNATETTHGPFNPSNPTSLRFTGRQMRMRVEGDQATNWRVGTMRLETKAGGRR